MTAGPAGLWSGSILAPLNKDLASNVIHPGTGIYQPVWTGTATNGSAVAGHALGASDVEYGLTDFTSASWIADDSTSGLLNSEPLYGISDELVVPTVPEPAAATIASNGGAVPDTRSWTRPRLIHGAKFNRVSR